MKKILIASAVAALFAVPALAAGPGGAVGAGVGANAGVNAGSRGPSVTATENANGSFTADRQFGLDRAQERMSEQGRAHERATTAAKKRLNRVETPRGGAAAEASGSGAADARTR